MSSTTSTPSSFLPNFLPSPLLEPGLHADMKIGEFRLVEQIGSGAMGVVWRALQQLTHEEREVAIKFCAVAVADRGSLAHEMELLDDLESNAGTVRTIGGGTIEIDGSEFEWFAMPLLERPLLELQKAPRKLRLQAFARACEIVEQIHDRGHIHRDLKPQHFYLNDDNHPVIIDFGLAATNLGGSFHTMSFAGTPQYMPRELFLGDTALHGRQDVYAMGVILLQLLADEVPYELPPRATLEELSAWWENTDVNVPPNGIEKLRPGLRAIVRRAVHPDPERRFKRIRDLRDAVVAYQLRWEKRRRVGYVFAMIAITTYAVISKVHTDGLVDKLGHLSTNLAGYINDSVRVQTAAHEAFVKDDGLKESLSTSQLTLYKLAEDHPHNNHIVHADAVVADAMGFVHYLNEHWQEARPFFARAINRGRQLTSLFPEDGLHHKNFVRATLRAALTEREGKQLAMASRLMGDAYERVGVATRTCGNDWLVRNSDLMNQLANMHLEHGDWDRAHELFSETVPLLPSLAEADTEDTADWVRIEFQLIQCAEQSKHAESYEVDSYEKVLRLALKRWDQFAPPPNNDVETVRAWLSKRK